MAGPGAPLGDERPEDLAPFDYGTDRLSAGRAHELTLRAADGPTSFAAHKNRIDRRARDEQRCRLGAAARYRFLLYFRTSTPLSKTRAESSENSVTEKPVPNIGMPDPYTSG